MPTYHFVHIEPSDDELFQEYRLFATKELGWAFITDWVRRGWHKTYREKFPEDTTEYEIWEYFTDADEACHFEELELETEWTPKTPTPK